MEKIQGLEDYSIDKLGNVTSFKNGKQIKKAIRIKDGYAFVKLQYAFGKGKYYSVHRLVAITYIENPENKPEVNHINGIKSDNRVENLEWVTKKENAQHAIKSGLTKQKGEDNKRSKLTNYEVVRIRIDMRSQRTIAKEYNISPSIVYGIKSGKRWAHVN